MSGAPRQLLWQDGVERPEGRLCLPPDDPALRQGRLVFETLRSHGGGLPLRDRHLARLELGARTLGLPWPGRRALARGLDRAVERLGEGAFRLVLTGSGWHLWARAELPQAGGPLRARTARGLRGGPPDVKHGNRLAAALEVEASGVDELILAQDGALWEGSWSNLWLPVGGGLRTPPADGRILPGITRGVLLDHGPRLGLSVAQGSVRAGEARAAGLWLSSSLRLLVGVGELDGEALPGESPAPLREALAAWLAEAGRQGRQV